MKIGPSISRHARELRYHMFAGLFWYLMGFVSWSGVFASFKYLSSRLGQVTTVLIDVACVSLVFFIAFRLTRMTSETDHNAGKDKLAVVRVWLEREDVNTPPHIKYRNKLRIALQNNTDTEIETQRILGSQTERLNSNFPKY